jgi:hypothetical protein
MKTFFMRNLLILSIWIICLFVNNQVLGQGTVNFANIVRASNLFAPVTFADGSPVGPNFQAQLYGAPAGSPLSDLKPLFPLTSFRASPPQVVGYIAPIVLNVPGIPAGASGVFVMKAFGSSWETSTYRGESNPVTVTLANGGLPPDLIGLQPFQVQFVPEPSTCALFVLGVGAFFLSLRRRRAV